MAEAKRMVTGFNHNVKHKGVVYHVQTEDSGLGNPHIITHLFVGGNILASRKTSYADIVGAENLVQVVRELMEEQHKEMLRNLVNGVYEGVHAAHAEVAQHWSPGELGLEDQPVEAPAAPPPPAPAAPAGPVRVTPRPPLPPAPEVAVKGSLGPVPGRPVRPTPPPGPGPQVPVRGSAGGPVATPAPVAPWGAGMGVGDGLVSERSLDEVILSYLAEDLGEKK